MRYVGIAKTSRRPLRDRLIDRFRDDSCFDVELDGLATEEAARVIDGRLRVAMPMTAEETRARYVRDHLKTSDMMRSITHVALAATDADTSAILDAEKVLVSSAWAISQPLANKSLKTFSGPATGSGIQLALAAIDGFGLGADATRRWKAQILERFTR